VRNARFLAEPPAAPGTELSSCTVRRHGIPKPVARAISRTMPTIRETAVVQMALKLVLEPISRPDFVTTS